MSSKGKNFLPSKWRRKGEQTPTFDLKKQGNKDIVQPDSKLQKISEFE